MLLLQSLDVGEGRSGNLLTLGSRKELDCVVAHINEQFRQKVNPKSKVLDLKMNCSTKVAVYSLGLRLNEESDGTIFEGVFKWSPWCSS